MEFNKKLSVVCVFVLCSFAYGFVDDIPRISKLCCDQGTSYARLHTSEDCSSSAPPPVARDLGPLCIYAMDACCKQYFQKKKECDTGVDVATNEQNCDGTIETVQSCCSECKRGIEAAGSGNSCTAPEGESPDQLLSGDAFKQCCVKTVDHNKKLHIEPLNHTTVGKPAHHVYPALPSSKEVSSLCEEYAPNELCAHHCIPVPGSYKCECNPGYKLMPDGKNCKEVTKNRCKPRNPCQHKCYDNGGADVQCSCKRGYELMADGKSCQDIDECTHDPPVCLPGTKCYNVHGSYKCIPVKNHAAEKGQCPPGFTRNLVNFACDDVNECLLPNPPCPSYLCENTIGGYKCDGVSGDPANLANRPRVVEERCPTGFKTGMNEECDDVDECAEQKDDCNHLSQFCINTHGSFYCQDQASKYCPPGFKIDPRTNMCEDINECEDEELCGDLTCTNLLGQYTCQQKRDRRKNQCPDGMRLRRGTSICEDIDECLEGTHLCDQYQTCHNTNGSHECRCKQGFEADLLTGACVDVNECATESHDCVPQSQRCDNTVGSYLCIRITSCGTGYILQHSTGQCEDINECALGQDDCKRLGPNFKCVNIPGSFRCSRVLPSTTTTTQNPDYEYYYDSDEEEINGTLPETTSARPEPSTPKPEPIPTSPTSPTTSSTTPDTRSERPEDNFVFTDKDPDTRDFNFGPLPTTSTYYETSQEPEKPQPKEERPQEPEKPQPKEERPQEPETLKPEERPSEPRPDLVEPPVYLPPEVRIPATSPKIVFVNKKDEETATVAAERRQDGSVFVDTQNLPEGEWTKINAKPIQCQIGFELDSFGACFDIDECATNRHICTNFETCRNTMGAYVCDCNEGYRRDLITGMCGPIPTTPVTTPPTPATTQSTTMAPTIATTPKYDYWGSRRKLPRPFRPRIRCDVGYHLNPTTDQCEDVNECLNGQANCAAVEICVNTEGGYRCDCPPKWVLDATRHRCVPARIAHGFPHGYGNEPVYQPPIEIEPPANKGTKYVKPIVTDLGNRRKVECQWGYRLGMDNICEDVNECATGEAKCGPMQYCTNLPGGYQCSCPKGHRLAGDHECADVDECDLAGNQSICSQNANCVNTVGSYQCQCHTGFRSAPANDKVCVDVDECSESPVGSLCEQRCNNVWGDYKCSCHRGYRLNKDNRTCSDVDECTEYKSKILCIGRCVNEPGSYRCTCPAGYRLSEDKRSCVDIDECETGEAPCASTAGTVYGGVSDVCLNTRGGYRCERITCPRGYQLESKHRCTKIEKVCAPTDWECAHQPTTYSFNFITFVSKLYIPDNKVDLFTMKGPAWKDVRENFELRLKDVNAPPTVKDKADINAFLLTKTGHQGMVSLVRPLQGPQSIELELSMELYSGDIFGGIAVAKLFIFVSEHEF
ncbi:fibrillin-1-like isoform X1 [Cydia pomonella]|uniref:fibrillin-1-like isoform X1 n=1 Tax=Cydia pomonella TaxID=82600 RepID=UPI002ADE7365|nr:fibrillin-1-like isoform X1 [Cydia pomonella]